MDFNLVLVIIFCVLMFIIAPIVCYIFCKREVLNQIRYIFLMFYIIVLFVGTTSDVSISDGLVHVNYSFAKIWGNKEMFWGFDSLGWFDVFSNLFMLIPIGTYIASDSKDRALWQTLFITCLWGMIVSLIIESMQYILPVNRCVEFSDTLFNTISAGIGALIILPFKRLRTTVQTKQDNIS